MTTRSRYSKAKALSIHVTVDVRIHVVHGVITKINRQTLTCVITYLELSGKEDEILPSCWTDLNTYGIQARIGCDVPDKDLPSSAGRDRKASPQ